MEVRGTKKRGDSDKSQQEMVESVRQTFSQALLLEMILDYAMRDENGALCPNNIQNLRLVQKSWKEAVSKKLRDNKEPLYRLKLDKNNSLMSAKSVQENGKLLDQFVDYWTTEPSAKKECVPTFRMELRKDYFRHENYDSLLNCVRKCGAGLVELEMNVPENGGSLTGMLPNVVLSALQKLTIRLIDRRLENIETSEVNVGHASNITYLFQSLLNKSLSLKELVLVADTWGFHSFPGLQYTALPTSLATIKIDFTASEKAMELLTRNRLPNLRHLRLSATNTSSDDGLVFRILENVRKTLCSLELYGERYSGPPRRVTNLRFPVMEKLQTLEIQRICFELEAEIPNMNLLFPKLEKLVLYDQTLGMLQKWTSGVALVTVSDLALELVDELKPEIACNTLPLGLDTMQSVHCRFPNVHVLNLRISGSESSGLKYVFMEMGQLTELHIYVVRSESVVATSDYWDSLLIGAPIEFVVGMSACPDFWDGVKLENRRNPSIRMLKELSMFSLEEENVMDDEGVDDDPDNPLISNLSFVYGFLQMPKLNHLSFQGRFKASEEMAIEWRKTGRTIKYSPL